MRPAFLVNRHKVAPVAARQNPARLRQRLGERLAVIGAFPERRQMLARLLRTDAGARALLYLLMARRPWRARLAVAFDMRALHPLMPEFPLQLARDNLMFAVIVAVADGAHFIEVDPRPHDVAMLAPVVLLMHHHDARLAG